MVSYRPRAHKYGSHKLYKRTNSKNNSSSSSSSSNNNNININDDDDDEQQQLQQTTTITATTKIIRPTVMTTTYMTTCQTKIGYVAGHLFYYRYCIFLTLNQKCGLGRNLSLLQSPFCGIWC
ncbi:hypothetical protein PoB_000472000 [Plakobranchus ocellatus]|uniref:Uncharacterized protein n=1 Tax=Plakobranchus ocellatus TaxID=259542 RepID=A0AAV3Y559_9GAST|nr:hypothetical protein PoB_000472000 [Plakobranchus ocellatus]